MSIQSPFKLEINIISAHDLPPVSKMLRTFAVAYIHPDHKLTTKIDHNGHTNPTWNYKVLFHVDEKFLKQESSAITIEIYNLAWLRDLPIGTARLSIANLAPPLIKNPAFRRVAIKISRPSGHLQGTLNLGVQLVENAVNSNSGDQALCMFSSLRDVELTDEDEEEDNGFLDQDKNPGPKTNDFRYQEKNTGSKSNFKPDINSFQYQEKNLGSKSNSRPDIKGFQEKNSGSKSNSRPNINGFQYQEKKSGSKSNSRPDINGFQYQEKNIGSKSNSRPDINGFQYQEKNPGSKSNSRPNFNGFEKNPGPKTNSRPEIDAFQYHEKKPGSKSNSRPEINGLSHQEKNPGPGNNDFQHQEKSPGPETNSRPDSVSQTPESRYMNMPGSEHETNASFFSTMKPLPSEVADDLKKGVYAKEWSDYGSSVFENWSDTRSEVQPENVEWPVITKGDLIPLTISDKKSDCRSCTKRTEKKKGLFSCFFGNAYGFEFSIICGSSDMKKKKRMLKSKMNRNVNKQNVQLMTMPQEDFRKFYV